MGRIHHLVTIGLVAFALAACSTGAPQRVEPGTASSPSVAWTPPANLPKPSPAQSTLPDGVTPGGPITLAQIIDVALTNNPDTRTAWLEARAAEAGVGSQRSEYFPEVDVLG